MVCLGILKLMVKNGNLRMNLEYRVVISVILQGFSAIVIKVKY